MINNYNYKAHKYNIIVEQQTVGIFNIGIVQIIRYELYNI